MHSLDDEWQPQIFNEVRTKGNENIEDCLLPSSASYTATERSVLISHSKIATTAPVRARMWEGKREEDIK